MQQSCAEMRKIMNEYPNQYPTKCYNETNAFGITREEKEERACHFRLFSLPSIIYALFYTFCLYKNASGITYPFFIGGTLFYFFLSLKKLGISAKKDSVFYVISIMLLGISTFCTDNLNIIFMNKLGIFLLTFILFIHNFFADTLWNLLKYGFAILQTILGSLILIGRPFSDFICYREINKENGNIKKHYAIYIFIGILISIPLTTFILLLLCSADAVFYYLFQGLSFSAFVYWLINHFTDLCFSMLFSFFSSYCILTFLKKKSIREEISDKRTGEPLIAITFTSILSVIYFLFSAVQIIYLFAGKGDIPSTYAYPDTYASRYSSYAREGYFQLLFVCMINLFLVLICLNRFKENKALKVILTIISLCTYIMMASSAMRMIMYIRYYDLTFLRIFVLWSLVVIFFIMTGILFYIYKKDFPLCKYCITIVTILYIGFSFSHPDYFIAKYNISQIFADEDYESDRYLYWDSSPKKCHYDTDYLIGLSADAAPAILHPETLSALISGPEKYDRWKKHWSLEYGFESSKPNRWMEYYAQNIDDYIGKIEKEGSKIRTFNLSRSAAKKYTDLYHMALFTKNKCPLFYCLI
jgi:hypothetical protein